MINNMNSIYNPELKWYNLPEKNEFIKILQDQGTTNFDPVAFYKESNKDEILKDQNSKLTKKQRKKMKKSKAALRIIAENKKNKEVKLRKDEDRKIKFYCENIKSLKDMVYNLQQMSTNYGRIKLKIKFLDYCLDENQELGSHLLFFSVNNEKISNELKNECKSIILKYKNKYKKVDLTKIQMYDMSSFLPPLDPFKNKVLKLDDWQINVFKHIEKKENILIVAPTSAGKTVCSTYCAVLSSKTLFVVPSNELARQVSGIFRNMDQNIGLITNNEYFIEDNFSVLIGTPYKLEEYLILNDHKSFDYVIYDEIQMLNDNEGDAFERIIKLMECPFLALSATIEKPLVLQDWLEKIKKQKVNLIRYKKRFIVQQRYLWNNDELEHLHPLSCIENEYVSNPKFLHSEMSFTPRDTYNLYLKMKELGINIKSPTVFFGKSKWDQITLNDTINYEKYLKNELVNLKKSNIKLLDNVLGTYKVTEIKSGINLIKIIKTLFKKKMGPLIIFKINPVMCQNIYIKLIKKLEDDQNKKYPYHYSDLETHYDIYSEYLRELEKNKDLTVPRDEDPNAFIEKNNKRISEKYLNKLKETFTKIIKKRIKHLKLDIEFYTEYYTQKLNKIMECTDLIMVDKNRPHPDFVFNNNNITSTMMRNIRRRLKQGLGEKIDWTHPFLQGIERGIAPYFKDMSTPYQFVVQSLYAQKILKVIISDESLGYGINMPIRTVVLLGNEEIEHFDVLKANQMSGRSGRRGIDNEGNIVYVNVNWKDILKGTYISLKGVNPINDVLNLPLYFNKLHKKDIIRLNDISLKQFVDKSFTNIKDQISITMKLVNSNNYSKHPINAKLIWSCRKFGNNCYLLPLVIIKLLKLKKLKKDISHDIIKYLCCLFDNNNNNIISGNFFDDIYEQIDKQNYPNIYDGNNLIKYILNNTLIKDNKDIIISRLRNINNIIVYIYESIKGTKYSSLLLNLKLTFEILKNIINQYRF